MPRMVMPFPKTLRGTFPSTVPIVRIYKECTLTVSFRLRDDYMRCGEHLCNIVDPSGQAIRPPSTYEKFEVRTSLYFDGYVN